MEDGRLRIEDGGWRIENTAPRSLNPLSSILHPQSSTFHPPSSILHPRSSILDPPSSIHTVRSVALCFSTRLIVERSQFLTDSSVFCWFSFHSNSSIVSPLVLSGM
jgi:hypothetical protein